MHEKEESYLEDFVYGAVDGTVTTFAVVAGVAGAMLSPSIVLILGFANLLADGFSMSVGNYLSTRARIQYIDKVRKRELKEIEKYPNEEKAELKKMFYSRGFKGDILDKIVSIISKDRKVWVDTIVTHAYGYEAESKNPKISAFVTYTSFILVGSVSLMPYLLGIWINYFKENSFMISIILTSIAFLCVGAIKSKVAEKPLVMSMFETLFLGGCAALISYIIGFLLRGFA